MPGTPEPIGKQKQLLVEGRSDQEFFKALLRHLGIGDVEVRSYGGKPEFRRFLEVFAVSPGFDEVQSLAIVRDADASAASAFQSIKDSLISVNLPAPEKSLAFALGSPRVGVFIMPNNADTGALEDLCLWALDSDPAMQCVSEFMQCIQDRSAVMPKNLAKGKMYAYLASREDPELQLGQAAHRGYLPWGDSAFDQLIQFVRGV